MPFWQELSHTGLMDALEKTHVAILPVGAVEAHGSHLPLGTDNILPAYLTDIVAKESNALVLPAIPYGDSWIFKQFEGTISVSPQTLVSYYEDVMNCIFDNGIRYLVVLNGHGGNSAHIESAAKNATISGERVVIIVNWWRDLAHDARASVLETSEGHAGEDETSEVLHVAPHLVSMECATASRVKQEFKVISGQFRMELVPDATFGDPRKATPEKGKTIMEQAAQDLLRLIGRLEKGDLPVVSEQLQ